MAVRHLGSRHDNSGRSTSKPADSRFRAMLGPPEGQPWAWLSREMLESAAFRGLSRAASHCLFRLILENLAHGGRENGNLAVTYANFEAYGVRANSISSALKELQRAGFIEKTVKGGLSYGCANRPSRFRLTWFPTHDGQKPTDDWRAIIETKSPRL